MPSFVLDRNDVLPHLNIMKSVVSGKSFGDYEYVMFRLLNNQGELELSVQNQTSLYSCIVPSIIVGAEGITEWAVDFKIFSNIINYTGGNQVKVLVEDNECQFLYDKLRVKSAILNKECVFDREDKSLASPLMSDSIYRISPYFSQLILAADANLFSRDNVVWFDKKSVFCTDGFRMNLYRNDKFNFETSFCISTTTASIIDMICQRQGNTEFDCVLNGDDIVVSGNNYYYSSNILLYDIPQYEYMSTFNRNFVLKVNRDEFYKNMPYVRLVVDKEQNEKVTVTMPTDTNVCIIKAKNEVGSCEAAIFNDIKFDKQVSFEVQYKHLIDCLSSIKTNDVVIAFSDDVAIPVLFTSSDENAVQQYVCRLDED